LKQEAWNQIEVVPNPHPDRRYQVTISIPEYTSVCPKTGLPDFGTLVINYVPDEYIIELKSLKYYILNYRNMGIFYEDVTNRILEDIKSVAKPREIEIRGEFNPRGGISTVVTSRWPQDE
jgi:7-cyano-7-deazaguanine reductase